MLFIKLAEVAGYLQRQLEVGQVGRSEGDVKLRMEEKHEGGG